MVAAWILATGKADRVWLLPTFQHAFGKDLAPFEVRVALVKEGFSVLGERVEVSTVESERAGPSYTVDTVEVLRARHPDHHFLLVVGTDALADRARWKDFDRLEKLVELLPVGRAGVPGAAAGGISPLFPDISSTQIRRLLAAGQSVEGLVAAGVLARIKAQGLYCKPTEP